MNWRFVREPKWLAAHVVIVALSVAMLSASFWQFDRLEQRKALNAQIEAAMTAEPVDISGGIPADIEEYRRVRIAAPAANPQTLYVRYPIQFGQSGFYVVTLYRLGDGTSLAVARGWIPAELGADDSPSDVPPALPVVEGLLRLPGAADEDVNQTSGRPPIPTITAVDTAAIQQLYPTTKVAQPYVQVIEQTFARPLAPITAPEINEGSHFAYALQWLAFTLIAVIGYAVVLVRTARDQSEVSANRT